MVGNSGGTALTVSHSGIAVNLVVVVVPVIFLVALYSQTGSTAELRCNIEQREDAAAAVAAAFDFFT